MTQGPLHLMWKVSTVFGLQAASYMTLLTPNISQFQTRYSCFETQHNSCSSLSLHVQWKYYDLPVYHSQDMKNTATAVVGIISLVTRRSVWRIVTLQLLQLRRMHDHRQVKTTLDPKCLKWHARNVCLHFVTALSTTHQIPFCLYKPWLHST